MRYLILTQGLPQSGKSTWSVSQGCPIVNRDAIRFAIGGYIRYFKEEERVSEIERIMVDALFQAGHIRVIVDATHLKKKYTDAWSKFADDRGYIFTTIPFFTSLEECVERAKKNFPEDKNFPNVIYNMWRNAEIDFHIPDQRRLCELAKEKDI